MDGEPLLPPPEPGDHLVLNDEADPTQDDEPHDGKVDKHVALKADETVGKEGIAAVVEGGDGMVEGLEKGLPYWRVLDETDKQQGPFPPPRWPGSKGRPSSKSEGKSLRGVWRKVAWRISLSLKEMLRPMSPKKTTEKVMIPSPHLKQGQGDHLAGKG
jgi:hypothetical protein